MVRATSKIMVSVVIIVCSIMIVNRLDGKHTIFGRVCEGMKIVQRLGCVQTDKNDRPSTEVKILKAQPRLAITD
jgi:cyclophilin family peptidyl-prolyl cis-trans isomerase